MAAADLGRVIGKDGGLPWRLPADLQRFKALTSGHVVVMGRRTFASLKRPLPNRQNVVVTSNAAPIAGCTVVPTLDDALAFDDVMIIGGARVYAESLPRAHRVVLTVVHARVDGDAFFPELKGWFIAAREPFAADADNAYDTTGFTLARSGGEPFSWPTR